MALSTTLSISLAAVVAGGSTFVALPLVGHMAQGGNAPPTCTAPELITVECNGDGMPSQHVLDAGVVDPDGDPLTFQWTLGATCQNAPGFGTLDDPTLENPTLSFTFTGPDCFAECGGVTLTVSDGINPPVSCSMALVIEDTVPPTITCPADVGPTLWMGGPNGGPNSGQTDPSITGVPTSTDACTPDDELVETFDDVMNYGTPPSGIEVVIDRTWNVFGCTLSSSNCTQTITLVGPSFFDSMNAVMDIDLGFSPSYVQVPIQPNGPTLQADAKPAPPAPLEAVVYGSETISATELVAAARRLKLVRADGNGSAVEALDAVVSDFGTPDTLGFEHTTVGDGIDDVMFVFDMHAVAEDLALQLEPDDAVIELHLVGNLPNGSTLVAKEIVQIQQ